jgi:ribokinase
MNDPIQTPIYVIGSINTDMIVKADTLPSPGQTVMGGDFLMTAGGKGGNQAVAAARHGAQVSMVANLGEEIFGDEAGDSPTPPRRSLSFGPPFRSK